MRLVLSPQAERDLSNLFDYIAGDSGVDRAEAILSRIDMTLNNLTAWPRIGRIRADLDKAPRAFTIWPWIILYEPLQEETGILVWRVIDGRRDLNTLVKRPIR